MFLAAAYHISFKRLCSFNPLAQWFSDEQCIQVGCVLKVCSGGSKNFLLLLSKSDLCFSLFVLLLYVQSLFTNLIDAQSFV